MHFNLKPFILILLFAVTICGCVKENKSENSEKAPEIVAVASSVSSKYTIGDSIKIGFSQKVSQIKLNLDGKPMDIGQPTEDTLHIGTTQEKTGWHKVVVSGILGNNAPFSDTIAVELISDIVPKEIKYTVLAKFPHLKSSFTEGLEFYKGDLYESTGENGKSQLLKIDLLTGNALKSIPLDQKYFGEGITIVKDKIYQLTWQSGVCFRYNLDFTLDKTFTYYFQGWGLTHHESTLMMSDGSNKIHFYNTEFEKTGDLEVYDNKGIVRNINELEYVDGFIYANIFETSKIIKIDSKTGKVVAFMKMESMIPAEIDSKKDVLNGIAYQASENAFYVTGKNWPLMFKIKLNNPSIL